MRPLRPAPADPVPLTPAAAPVSTAGAPPLAGGPGGSRLRLAALLVWVLALATLPAAAPAGARSPAAPPPVPAVPGYRWPLPGTPTVTRPFQPPPVPWLPGHRGVDLAGYPGEPVLAAGAGVVSFAGTVAGVGVLSVQHPGGLRTTYEPVTVMIHAGQPVVPGQRVGTLLAGHAGCPVMACLHWGLRRGATYLDPL